MIPGPIGTQSRGGDRASRVSVAVGGDRTLYGTEEGSASRTEGRISVSGRVPADRDLCLR